METYPNRQSLSKEIETITSRLQQLNLPDNVIYKLAFGYPLLPQKYPPQQVNIFAELLGNYILDGVGNNLFFAPGIQYKVAV